VDEEEARLTLLTTELSAVGTAIRSLNTIEFQIKGLAVTAALAVGGLAISEHDRRQLFVGTVATIDFWSSIDLIIDIMLSRNDIATSQSDFTQGGTARAPAHPGKLLRPVG